MAKKKSSKKATKKATPRYRNKRTNGHGAKWSGADSRRAASQGKPTARARGPRSQSLPGMAQVHDQRLKEICESIGEGLDAINSGTEAVAEGKVAAMQRLQAKNLGSYRHAGVRVTLVPGADKVSVKREKDREVTVAVGAGASFQETDEPGAVEDVDGDLAGAADLT